MPITEETRFSFSGRTTPRKGFGWKFKQFPATKGHFHCLLAIRLSHFTFENDMTIAYFKDVAKSGVICQRIPKNWSMSKKHNWVPRLSSPCWLKGGGTGMVSWSKAIPLRWDGLHLALAQLSNHPSVHTNAHLRATHCKPIYCNWILSSVA